MSTEDRRKWGNWIAVDAKPEHTTAMSVIWRVRNEADPSLPPHALKELRYPKGRNSTAMLRFAREIEIVQRLQPHDGIVTIVDVSLEPTEDASSPYIVMPRAPMSLERSLKARRGELEYVLKVGVRLAAALEHTHHSGIIHRDVKPSNILLFGEELTPTLCDFGIGFLIEDERLTRTEAHTVGTDGYVAPELLGGGVSDQISVRADIYSLGKTLYAMASGGVVLPRERLTEDRYDLVAQLEDPRAAHLVGILERMIVEDPNQRYENMKEVREALERAFSNIKNSVPYSPGMYGGRNSPLEEALRFREALARLEGVNRTDRVREAIATSVDQGKAIAIERGQTPRLLRRTGMDPIPKALAVTEEIVDSLLAVGVPLLLADDGQAYARFQGRLREGVTSGGHHASEGLLYLYPVACTAATHLLCALALELERSGILKSALEAQESEPDRWLHHHILGDSSPLLTDWVIRVGEASQIIRRFVPQLSGRLQEAVWLGSGLLILRGLFGLPQDRLAWHNAQPNSGLPIEAFGGWFWPGVQWTTILPQRLLQDDEFESWLARTAFGVTASELRTNADGVTHILATQIALLARPTGQMLSWGIGRVGGGWGQWIAKGNR